MDKSGMSSPGPMAPVYHDLSGWWACQPPPLLWGLGGVVALLALGMIAATLMPALRPGKDYRELRLRVSSWFWMILILAAALLSGWQAMTLLFMAVSFIALREFLSLAPMRREDRLILLVAYLA